MAINDFIISTLNVSDDMIFSIDTHKSSDKLHILIKLNDTHPTCPCCGGHSKIKNYSSYSYNHLDVAGIPSIIDWTRRRYVCKECGKSFSRLTLPENLGIDEISSSMAKYGGSYLCVFVDNNNRTLNEIL